MSLMPQTSGLCGRSFLVTRPEGQAAGLIAGIQNLGCRAEHIPFLAIEPLADLAPLEVVARSLTGYAACIFISANAARLAWPVLSRAGWPQAQVAACIGPGTARVLRDLGVQPIVMPEARYDSEGLLAEAYFVETQCQGKAFALIRGEGGRDVLAQTLRTRGATVDEVPIYRRCLHPQALSRLQAWLAAGGGALVISSSESLRQVMVAAMPVLQEQLRQQPVLVPHPRIADVAVQLGFADVAVTAGGDAGLLDALRSYNRHRL